MCNYELFNKNNQLIQSKYPSIIKQLNNIDNNQESIQIEVADSRDGNKSMTIKSSKAQLYIHSRYRPIEEANKFANLLDFKKNSIIIIFGIGLGYYAREILNKNLNIKKIILIEPSTKVFMEMLNYTDIEEFIDHKKVELIVDRDYLEWKNILLNNIGWEDINYLDVIHLPNYDRVFKEEYDKFIGIVKEVIYTRKVDKNTILYFSEQWQENLFRNLNYIFESTFIKEFYGSFKNKPAIIVSAGPSLNKNVDLLKKIEDKAIIICVGTALRVLLNKGIRPHLVITMDGGIPNYKHFQGIDYSDIPLVYAPTVNYNVLGEHNGEKIVFLNSLDYAYELSQNLGIDIGFLKSGGSVACSAFDLAVKIGANPIVFVGQDLAYQDNKSHADGVTPQKKEKIKYRYVPSIYGKEIKTSDELYTYLLWFNREIAMDKSNTIYIDATEGGARIEGTKMMTLREVIDKYCRQDIGVESILREILHKGNLVEIEEYKKVIEELKTGIKHLDLIIDEIDSEFLTSNDNLINNASLNSSSYNLEELYVYANKKVKESELVKYILQPIFYNDDIKKENSENDDIIITIKKKILKAKFLLCEAVENLKEEIITVSSFDINLK